MNQPARGGFPFRTLIFLAVLVTIGGVTAYLLANAESVRKTPTMTHRIARGKMQVTVKEEGSLQSSNNREIKCKVKGGSTVLSIVKAGTQVKAGDLLIRLDQSTIEDNINEQRIRYENALSLHAKSMSDLAVAKINLEEFEKGTHRAEKQELLKDIKKAETDVLKSKDTVHHSRTLYEKGFITEIQLKADQDTEIQKQIELEVFQTKLEVLDRYTRAKKMEELGGIVKASEAKLNSDKAALDLEKSRLDRQEEQLKNCTITADAPGLVIYPNTEQWKNQPAVEEGATVREDQVLLMIPDLDQMQVKLGVHEAYVDKIKRGLKARVQLQNDVTEGEVESIVSVAQPAGWWNGNQVKYDTIVSLKSPQGLKPGMSASVEILLADYESELLIPVAGVLEQNEEYFCWIVKREGLERRRLDLGDSNDQFIVVKGGISEGDEVVLNPRSYVEEAQIDALKPIDHTRFHSPKDKTLPKKIEAKVEGANAK